MGIERQVSSATRDKLAARPEVRVAQLAGRQCGVVTSAELQACGLTRDAIRRRVGWGWLHPVHHGMYAVGHRNLSQKARFMTAVKACGSGAVLSHYAALAKFELLRWDGREIDVTVPRE